MLDISAKGHSCSNFGERACVWPFSCRHMRGLVPIKYTVLITSSQAPISCLRLPGLAGSREGIGSARYLYSLRILRGSYRLLSCRGCWLLWLPNQRVNKLWPKLVKGKCLVVNKGTIWKSHSLYPLIKVLKMKLETKPIITLVISNTFSSNIQKCFKIFLNRRIFW